jgi:hypothetical protein
VPPVVSDNDSKGWTPYNVRPNLDVTPEDIPDFDGLKSVGWKVGNRDENLTRYLHGIFTWDGAGEEIAQSEVMNVHGCAQPPAPRASFPVPNETGIRAGLLIAPGKTEGLLHREVRESGGPWIHMVRHRTAECSSSSL